MDKKQKILKFSDNFLWGVSTSAYQIEGGIKNDWSEWEHSNKRIKELERNGKDPKDFICGLACDSYHKYEEDFSLARDLNSKAFRFGIEWARIEPQEGQYNIEAIEHYKKVLSALREKGLKPVVTLWHWTNPIWVAKQGGWSNKKTVESFTQYTELVVREFGEYIDFWITLNEPMVHVVNGYITAKFPPNIKCPRKAFKVFNNLVKAHNNAYDIIHKKFPEARVSITALVNYFEPARKWCLIERGLSRVLHYFWNERFLKKIKNHIDFVAFDYYFHDRIIWRPPFMKNLNKKTTDMGWEIYPEGIYHVLKYLAKFKKPIYIMENGIADANDKKRADFIKKHLFFTHKAIEDGVDVRGYFYWSLLDNFEWAAGWAPKFGLYEVNRKNFERIARPSAEVYKEICKSNKLVFK